MREIVIVSGKGGTGKTTLAASFASLEKKVMLADCDVDAANLHLVVEHQRIRQHAFIGGRTASIDMDCCIQCDECVDNCRFSAISKGELLQTSEIAYCIDPLACEGCGVCALLCPTNAVSFQPRTSGEWCVSNTENGAMVHAQLGAAEGNSGKLVNLLRQEARHEAGKRNIELIITDGSPGIGCPVVASLTGADLAVIVTEPSLSSLHDFERVVELIAHFSLPSVLCINKCDDLNSQITSKLKALAQAQHIVVAGEIRYDPLADHAQMQGRSLVSCSASTSALDIRQSWSAVKRAL